MLLHAIEDDELGLRARGVADVLHDLARGGVVPVVDDGAQEVDGGVFDGLGPEEVVWHNRDGAAGEGF